VVIYIVFFSEYERLRTLNGKRIKENTLKLIDLFYRDFHELAEVIKVKESYYENLLPDDQGSKELYKDNNSDQLK